MLVGQMCTVPSGSIILCGDRCQDPVASLRVLRLYCGPELAEFPWGSDI